MQTSPPAGSSEPAGVVFARRRFGTLRDHRDLITGIRGSPPAALVAPDTHRNDRDVVGLLSEAGVPPNRPERVLADAPGRRAGVLAQVGEQLIAHAVARVL